MESLENHQWMLHVLSDLERYARLNNLPFVEQKIAVARQVMLSEFAERLELQFSRRVKDHIEP